MTLAISPARRLGGGIATLLIVTFAAALLIGGAGVVIGHLAFQPVLSGSMRPAIQPGDLAVTQPVAVSSLRVGDVVAYFPPGGSKAVLHRITEMGQDAGRTWVITKGDANPTADAWGRAILRGDTAVRLAGVVPMVGFVADVTQYRGPILILAGLLLGVGVAVTLVRRRRDA